MEEYKSAIQKALQFAVNKPKTPKKYHECHDKDPMTLPNTLINIGKIENPEVLQAAILHDIVECSNTTFEEVEKEFGKQVTSIVRELTPTENGGNFKKPPETTELSTAAKEILLADHLVCLTAVDEKHKNLTDAEMARFRNTALEIEHYRGTNKEIEKMLDNLFKKRNISYPSAPKERKSFLFSKQEE